MLVDSLLDSLRCVVIRSPNRSFGRGILTHIIAHFTSLLSYISASLLNLISATLYTCRVTATLDEIFAGFPGMNSRICVDFV